MLLKTKQHNSIKTNGKLHKIIFISSEYRNTHGSFHSSSKQLPRNFNMCSCYMGSRVEQLVRPPQAAESKWQQNEYFK
jgi:16S rRNA C1402 N4-methylase RsmH